MSVGRLGGILQHLRGMIAPSGDTLTDRRLLDRFFQDGDQTAFAALVERHGGMVRGVCRRILGEADADDAFQATFLVLASKGRQVRWQESIAGWLWSVAYRVACKARTRAARRQRHESEAGRNMRDIPNAESTADLREVLNEELARLPDRYRLPLVLCYLEGQTTDQAAEQLCWPRGTVAGRLSRARETLRRRLERRHLAPTAVALTAALAPEVSAAPPTVVAATVQAASMIVLGNPLTQLGLSPAALELTQGVLSDMFRAKMKVVALSLIVLAGLGLGTGKVAHTLFTPRAEAAPVNNAVAKAPEKEAALPAVRRLDVKLDPKQDGKDGPFAIIPLGSEAEAIKVVGQFTAKQLAELVDFKKEKVVFVRWSGGGPPFDTIEYDLKKVDAGYEIRFFKKPAVPPGTERGAKLKLGRDYFAVPKDLPLQAPPAPPKKGEPLRELESQAPEAGKQGLKLRELDVVFDRDRDVGPKPPQFDTYSSNQEVARAFGPAIALQLAKQVDYTKEKIVRVGFKSNGPPFDTLEHQIVKQEGGELAAEFAIRVPTKYPRTRSHRIVHQFVAVPRALRIKPELGVIPPPRDEPEPRVRSVAIKSEAKGEVRQPREFETINSAKDVLELCGQTVADELARNVDFTRECVCLITCTRGETVAYEVITAKDGSPRVEFDKKAPAAREGVKVATVRSYYAFPIYMSSGMASPK